MSFPDLQSKPTTLPIDLTASRHGAVLLRRRRLSLTNQLNHAESARDRAAARVEALIAKILLLPAGVEAQDDPPMGQ